MKQLQDDFQLAWELQAKENDLHSLDDVFPDYIPEDVQKREMSAAVEATQTDCEANEEEGLERKKDTCSLPLSILFEIQRSLANPAEDCGFPFSRSFAHLRRMDFRLVRPPRSNRFSALEFTQLFHADKVLKEYQLTDEDGSEEIPVALQYLTGNRSPHFDALTDWIQSNACHDTKGLTHPEIESIPSFVYSTETCCVEGHSLQCGICLSEYEEKDLLKKLPFCQHVFHNHCIDKWLSMSKYCPICRSSL